MTRAVFFLVLALPLSCGGAHVRRGDAALEDGKVSLALHAYRSALERRPEDGRALLGLASAHLADDDPDAAIAPARAAHAAGIRGADLVLARALVEVGQGADAHPLAAAAAEREPRSAPVLALLVEAELARADLPAARAAAERLIAADPSPRERSLAAWVYARTGDGPGAASLASQAAATALEDIHVQSEAAAILSLGGEQAGARAAAKAAIGRGASAGRFANEAARRDQGGDREGAIRRLSWAVALDPDEGKTTASLGQLYLARGADERAATLLERALTLHPYRDPKVSGVTVLRPDDWAEAVRRQKVGEVLRALGIARQNIGDLRGAARALQQAAELTGGSVGEWLAVADAWERAKVTDATLEALNRAVSADASNQDARRRLARALAAAGQLGAAIGQARAAWERTPRDVDAALLLGALYEARGERQAARDLYTTVLRSNPGESRLVEALARLGG